MIYESRRKLLAKQTNKNRLLVPVMFVTMGTVSLFSFGGLTTVAHAESVPTAPSTDNGTPQSALAIASSYSLSAADSTASVAASVATSSSASAIKSAVSETTSQAFTASVSAHSTGTEPVSAASASASTATSSVSVATSTASASTSVATSQAQSVAPKAMMSLASTPASTVTAPTLTQAPTLSNFFVSPNGNYVLYNAQATLDLYPYNVSNHNKQLYGFYVVLPQSITGQSLDKMQSAADALVTQMKALGFTIDTLTVVQLNDTTDGREVYYFRPNDGANDTGATIPDSSKWATLHLPINTGADVSSTPKTIQMNANTMSELATNGVLFAGSGSYPVPGAPYPTVSSASLGINAPDANLMGIVYTGIGRTLTYMHVNVTDTYNVVDAQTGKVIKILTKSGQDGTQYSRQGFVDTLAALGLDPTVYNGQSMSINDGTLTGEVTFAPSVWNSSGQTNVPGQTYTITVGRVKTSINGHDSNLIAGSSTKWQVSDNFDGATDINGNPVSLSEVHVDGTVNPRAAGDYPVTYSYTDTQGNVVSKKVTVHVTATKASVTGHDSNLIAGPNTKWQASDNFDGATDANGNPVTLNNVSVSGTVNPQVPGDYAVTYSYTDTQGNVVSKIVTVHVTASKASVTGHDSTVIAGPNTKWQASDNFDGATDINGNSLTLTDVTVSGSVNPQVAGDYPVIYSYTDVQGNVVSKTATIHVTATKASVTGHDSTVIAGPNTKWQASDNFDGAMDENGNPLTLTDVTVSGSVNSQVAGDYAVTYSYTDAEGNQVSKTITVHVIKNNDAGNGGNQQGNGGNGTSGTPTTPGTTGTGTTGTGSATTTWSTAQQSSLTQVGVTTALPARSANSANQQKQAELPETGEQYSNLFAVIMLAVLGLLGLVGYRPKHRKRN
ncbi:bacterial Ig-like domain-containing protein [Furfurilactobacillus entadae]|uniref:bacterial Ig-like domain-containing protein n=1 Tax=Furfurilactobacillus entadae TaxID=2922307 RepID=UPI0035E930A5